MNEYVIYDYLKSEIKRVKGSTPFHVPITEDLVRHLVGQFGLDILRDTKLIEPTTYPGQYVMSCEATPV